MQNVISTSSRFGLQDRQQIFVGNLVARRARDIASESEASENTLKESLFPLPLRRFIPANLP